MRRRFQAVVFDFDYTLADSSRGVVACVNGALAALGLPTVSAEEAHRTIGLSLADTFLEVTGREYTARSDELAREFARLFVARADVVMADLTVFLEPVPEVVTSLREQGIALGIVSTKFRYRIESILKREGMLDSFDVIVGGEDVVRHKPAPDGLLGALERLSSPPDGSLYVGDSVTDAETARRAGVPFAAVLSGVTPREAFVGYPLWGILEDLSELPSFVGAGG